MMPLEKVMISWAYIATRRGGHAGSGLLGHSRGVHRGTRFRAPRHHHKASSVLQAMFWPAGDGPYTTSKNVWVGEEEEGVARGARGALSPVSREEEATPLGAAGKIRVSSKGKSCFRIGRRQAWAFFRISDKG